jgi:mRNA interferase MazF
VTAHGEVWLVRADKPRPAIVLTRDPIAGMLDQILVVAITRAIRGLPVEVPVGPADGVRVASVANLDTIQLLAREAFIRRVGHVRPSTMAAICDALHYAVGC